LQRRDGVETTVMQIGHTLSQSLESQSDSVLHMFHRTHRYVINKNMFHRTHRYVINKNMFHRTHRYVINKNMCSKELTDMLMFHRTYRYIITCPTGILLIRNIWLDHLTNKNLMSFFVDQLSITFQDFIFFFRNIYSANQN
jgi:hypothetical protein